MHSLKILVAPLDWGLGHATRCIPIINELVSLGCSVWLAGEGKSMHVLRIQFPELPVLSLKGYSVFYHNTKSNFGWTIAKQVPKIIASIRRENKWMKKIMDAHHFDVIISDNRYGLYSNKAISIMITHQLNIKTGWGNWADKFIQAINYRAIKNFDACWIPDYEGPNNLAGNLSHPVVLPRNARYIGALSRFNKKEENKKYDLLIILSGPEPRRTIWENVLFQQLKSYNGKVLLVRGLPGLLGNAGIDSPAEIVNYLSAQELNTAILKAEWVICRSGYTSVMDLAQLGSKAILVPTPGQPEQEYLAGYLHQKQMFYATTENSFSLQQCLMEAAQFPFSFTAIPSSTSGYKAHLARLLQQVALKYSSSDSSQP